MKSIRVGLLFSVLILAAGCSAQNNAFDGYNADGRRTEGGSGEAGDATTDTLAERCATGVDSDRDGLNNDVECTLGSDPFVRDTDGDGLLDGTEAMYPRICVADDRAAQVRPPVSCTVDTGCMPGEHCRGLDPASADSDGDGVPDATEDPNRDGTIDVAHGETDPRLWDTDGDGLNDSMGGLDICRPDGLAMVTQAELPGGGIQAGHDPAWGASRPVTGTMNRSALVLDDAATNVAAIVAAQPSVGDVRVEATRLEAAITAALGAGVTPVLVGRSLVTHEMNPAITSTFRVARATSASALRDALVMPLVGSPATAGAVIGTSAEFFVDVTTVARMGGTPMARTDIIVAISPRAEYDNTMTQTSIRVNDLVNATGIAEAGKILGAGCQVFRADRVAMADFIWTVDTSGSMGDDQARLGNTAAAFFTRLAAAGVDFRVGVIQAGHTTLNLATPGFHWISGTDAMGAQLMCEQVTSSTLGRCPTSPTDTLSPYPFAGSMEEPVAAGVLSHRLFANPSAADATNPDRTFRAGAKVVSFMVTDEPGSNDFTRYFMASSDPQTSMPWGATYNATTLSHIVDYFHRNEILTFGMLPVSATPCATAAVADLPRCVVEGNGGAVIPITTATDAEVSAAMARIVDAVAGATSQFMLERSPITSTIQVRVHGMPVPRSRASGFDYDPVSRSVVFFGTTFRPAMGDQVVISYRVWEGSLG